MENTDLFASPIAITYLCCIGIRPLSVKAQVEVWLQTARGFTDQEDAVLNPQSAGVQWSL